MPLFEYDNSALDYLKAQDPKISILIDKVGKVEFHMHKEPFTGLLMSVASQQLSGKAADTIWNRLCAKAGEITPENILKLSPDDIRSCGMSYKKADYILGIAQAAAEKRIDFNNLDCLSDDEAVKLLSSLHGVGIWTTEMLLLFSLGRMDILSYGDLGIRTGLIKLHGLEKLSKKDFEYYKELYSPYGSVASLYLWKLANNDVEL